MCIGSLFAIQVLFLDQTCLPRRRRLFPRRELLCPDAADNLHFTIPSASCPASILSKLARTFLFLQKKWCCSCNPVMTRPVTMRLCHLERLGLPLCTEQDCMLCAEKVFLVLHPLLQGFSEMTALDPSQALLSQQATCLASFERPCPARKLSADHAPSGDCNGPRPMSFHGRCSNGSVGCPTTGPVHAGAISLSGCPFGPCPTRIRVLKGRVPSGRVRGCVFATVSPRRGAVRPPPLQGRVSSGAAPPDGGPCGRLP